MRSKIAEKVRKRTPLHTRLEVEAQVAFVDLITILGYREDKVWTREENELLQKISGYSIQHAKNIVKIVEQWEKDGRPDKVKQIKDRANE